MLVSLGDLSAPAGAALAAGAADSGMAAAVPGNAAAFWVILICVLAVFFIAKFNPLRFVATLIRFMTRVLRWPLGALLRLFRLGRTTTRQAVRKGVGAAQVGDGLGMLGPLARLFGTETRTDRLLADLQANEKKCFSRRGFLFRYVHPLPEQIPEVELHSDADAAAETEHANQVFKFNIPIDEILKQDSSVHQYFYEDVENEFIIRLFRGADSNNPEGYVNPEDPEQGKRTGPDDAFYFIGDAIRKVINSNVRTLATVQTLILTFVLLANVFFSQIHDAIVESTGMKIAPEYFGLPPGDSFSILLFVTAFMLIALLNVFYNFSQRNGARELDTYVRSYLAALNSRFRLIDAGVSRLIAATADPESQKGAGIGVNKLHWLGWRIFFIEKFLRGIFYQIKRNTINYMLVIPLLLFGLTFYAFDGIQRGVNSSVDFPSAWNQYRNCMAGETPPLDCARTLSASRPRGIWEQLSTWSNCVEHDETSGRCAVTLDDRVAARIVALDGGGDPERAISVTGTLSDASGKLQRLTDEVRKDAGLTSSPWLFLALFSLQIAWYIWNLARAPQTIRNSIEEGPWLEFHKLSLNDTIERVIGRFIAEISRLVNLYGGRGGGH
jgi:hypothetical protein